VTVSFYDSLSNKQKKKVDDMVKVRWEGILQDATTDTQPRELDVLREQVSREMYKIING
jgi:hypothetical protein